MMRMFRAFTMSRPFWTLRSLWRSAQPWIPGAAVRRIQALETELEDQRMLLAGITTVMSGWRPTPWEPTNHYAWIGRHPAMRDAARLRRAAELLAGEDCVMMSAAFRKVEQEEAAGLDPVHVRPSWVQNDPHHPDYAERQRNLADLRARDMDEH